MQGDSIYMKLAALAYMPPAYVKQKVPYLGFCVARFLTKGPAQGYLFKGGRQAILAYRGTEASKGHVRDILSNIRVHAREWEGPGKAHLGYVRQYRAIRDDAIHWISRVSESVPLVVTGHSMGGAMATMAAADCFERKWNVSRLITFGSPATLDDEGHYAIECPHARYVNRFDPAPLWPPSFTIDHGVDAIKVDSKNSVFNRHAPEAYLRAMENYEKGFYNV
jgi:pimeloyl-ACP methyl ester carboxylesterase